ncbi:hypothetical protein NDU88_007389 [Pleurodeles waltl]|uniref:Uncharacterized protein n=1 Tax=Pleurodeles waltl TaxID=8319 RepID=A0AAV7PR97_PLEWA|nr:hypothetical protein NDU88_007389 [Pleurodeles waltl]
MAHTIQDSQEKRKMRAELVFSKLSTGERMRQNGEKANGNSDVYGVFKELERNKKRELNKWWECESFNRYLEAEIIPRGLRIFIMPTYDDPHPDLLKEWAAHNAVSSAGMMKILIKYAQLQRERVIEKIEDLAKTIKTFSDRKLVESLNSSMEERLAIIEEEIIPKKARKFKRDVTDYETGQIYTFAKKFDYWRKQKGVDKMTKMVDVESKKSTDVSESSDTDFEEAARIKVHTSLQDEFDFLRKDRRTNHRPWRGTSRPRGRGRGRKDEGGRETNTEGEKVTRSNKRY